MGRPTAEGAASLVCGVRLSLVRPSADAIDRPQPEAVSFLPHEPNVVAQSLLRNPALRGLPSDQLARATGVKGRSAVEGIASVVGMVNRIARHAQGRGALENEPRLTLAIGPFVSLDEAMARYGSHRGPIVVSPSPLSPYAGSFTEEAGDTLISDQGDPANYQGGGGGQPANYQGGGSGPSFLGGGASPEQPPQVLGDQGGPSPAPGPSPSPDITPTQTSGGGIPGWVWAVGAAAVVLVVAGRKKRAL